MAEPRSVTFGGDTQDEIQYRAARRGEAWLGVFLAGPAIALTVVAAWQALNFSTSLSSSWIEAIKLGVISVAVTLAMTGLPIAAALMSRSYPALSRWAMRAWLAVIGFAAVSMGIFVWQLEPQERAAAPDEKEIRRQVGLSDVVWRYSNRCRQPENDGQQATCDRYQAALTAPQPSDWRPRTLFSIATTVPDGTYRRISVAVIGLMAVFLAGGFGLMFVLASSESHRLGTGEASALTGTTLQSPAVSSGEQFDPQPDIFEPWAELNLLEAQGAFVSVTAAHDDYEKICRANFQVPMGLKPFAQALQARAMASRGRIVKKKVNGLMRYDGWQLASERVMGLKVVGSQAPVARIENKRS